jgi:protein-S-isoprenylcysteine O-methyltransferase
MGNTFERDRWFVACATLVWAAGLGVTAWDFLRNRKGSFRFGPLNLLGLGAMVGGVTLRALARKALREQFSYKLRVRDGHRLVREGIYRRVRHPAYTGDIVFHLGLPLLFSSPRGFLVMLGLIPCFLYRIRIEEEMLVDAFGEEYREYRGDTWALLPRFLLSG